MSQPEMGVRGRKRPAEGELGDQPLAKRFGRLHIARPGEGLDGSNDAMMLDDTKHTIYIHDLDKELAEADALGVPLSFLPGLEDRLPMSRMLVSTPRCQGNELVLYREPESLSIPKDKDQVRRALIETRERARFSQKKWYSEEHKVSQVARQGLERNSSNTVPLGHDMMEIDSEVIIQ
ncbi:hypothetical protein BJX61DRAFT_538076 [Aspergillus egyptiacus]|nr:hypothetical protein BJX61DRAFT_538076 [Aspergillus egyptiacus]